MIAAMEKNEKEEIVLEMRQIAGVLTEHYDDKIKLVVEQYGGLGREIDGMKKTLMLHTEMFKDMAVDIVVIKSDIGAIKAQLNRKADVKDLAVLDRRVSAMEKSEE